MGVLQPLTMSTQSKLEANWKGPCQILSRNGKRSYLVGDKKGVHLLVHVYQLKPYVTMLGENGELAGLDSYTREVENITAWRAGEGGEMEYQVTWKSPQEGSPPPPPPGQHNHPCPDWWSRTTLLAMGHGPEVQDFDSHALPPQ